MFAKLKQKIQEEGADLSKGFQSSSQPVPNANNSTSGDSRETTPVRNFPLIAKSKTSSNGNPSYESKRKSRSSSSESLNESSVPLTLSHLSSSHKGFSITDSPETNPASPGSSEGDGEQRVRDLLKSLKEEKRQNERLQSILEKQQDIYSKRSEEKERDWRSKVETLEKDKAELTSQLVEVGKWKDKYIRNHEAAEELEGFQTQELAKVKHLLLLSQQDLQRTGENLKLKEMELETARQSFSTLQSENGKLQWKNSHLDEECEKLKTTLQKDSEALKDLREVKETLGKKVMELTWQIEESNTKTNKFEKLLSETQDEHDTLKHAYEVYAAKCESTLKEKDALIAHSDERIATLEKRLAETNLGDDDKLKALVTERDSLETKLEESRQHLNEVKTSWSDKITSLEKQIANLNKKMADDREEFAKSEVELNAANGSLKTEVASLMNELENCRTRNQVLNSKSEQNEAEFKKQKQDLRQEIQQAYQNKEEAVRLLEERIQAFEERITVSEKEKDGEVSKYQNKIAQLESKTTEYLSKENELQKQINRLLDEKSKAEKTRKSLEDSISQLQDDDKSLNQKLDEVERKLREKTESESSIQSKCNDLERLLLAAKKENESLVATNEALQNQLKELQTASEQQQNELDSSHQKLAELQIELESVEEEKEILRKKISDLEKSLDANHLEGSDRVKELKTLISDLENQLTEKNKTVKLQQQRLSDMKKTLQKELKIQSSSALDVLSGETNDTTTVPSTFSLPSFPSRISDSAMNSFMQHGRAISLSGKLDDINFRYIKHVLLKFITSREYEALQLIKAIGVLLDFTPEEEQLVRDTLDWKMSWFGSKPQMTRLQVGSRTIMS